MIASIEGIVAASYADHLVVVVGGIGYKIFVPRSTIVMEGETVHLHTEMIVREDAITLFGFVNLPERDTFIRLITVSGVGPKLALAILGTMSIDSLRNAVSSGQPELLTRVPGIGKKMAEKIVFELKDKLKGADGLISSGAVSDVNRDVLDALTSFGYSIAEAQAALEALPPDTPNNFEERMRRALQYFV
ncbi:MAG: Holliday junction branch migration protein RuvA [Chloroflexota bacterium]